MSSHVMEDKIVTKRINGKYVWSRGIYMGDQWGRPSNKWSNGTKSVKKKHAVNLSFSPISVLFPVLKLIFNFHAEFIFPDTLTDLQ